MAKIRTDIGSPEDRAAKFSQTRIDEPVVPQPKPEVLTREDSKWKNRYGEKLTPIMNSKCTPCAPSWKKSQ